MCTVRSAVPRPVNRGSRRPQLALQIERPAHSLLQVGGWRRSASSALWHATCCGIQWSFRVTLVQSWCTRDVLSAFFRRHGLLARGSVGEANETAPERR